MVAAPTVAGAASPGEEADFVARINNLRASQGLPPMTPDAGLAATSCTWNDKMIAAGGISHDPNLAAAIASVFPDWRKGGENVGMGGTVSSLFDAFVASPGHYKNLVDPEFSRVGVCVGRDGNGKLYTTHRFAAVAAAAPAPPPPPTTAAPPPPPPTAPPTTAAPPPAPTAPPTTAAPPPAPTAPPTTAAPPPAPPTTAATTTAPVASAAPLPPTSLLVAALPPSSTSAVESTLAPDSVATEHVHELVIEILDLFPAFLHLRLP
jgi:hypothetical protein